MGIKKVTEKRSLISKKKKGKYPKHEGY